MYYNRILKVWVFDLLDYFLISALLGSLLASYLKKYFSEKAAKERLKNSIIKKSKLISSKTPISNSKKAKIKRIYKFALHTNTRGGEFEEFDEVEYKLSNEIFKLAEEIKGLIERLAKFLKERELKGILKIFFKSGRLILELILYKCNINVTYSILTEGLNTQVIVLTATAGGTAGFTISWFSAGASLVFPPMVISLLFVRSLMQQIKNIREYSKFKKMVKKLLDEKDIKETLQAIFMESDVDGITPSSGKLEMKPLDLDKNFALKYNFESKSSEEFIKAKMEKELGLVENPTQTQLDEIIQRKIERRPKGKTVFWRDFIDEIHSDGSELSDIDDILDAEILEEPIRIKLDKEL